MSTLAPPASTDATASGPWNPGLESTIPEELRPLCTLLRPENVFTTVAEARELRAFTGLPYADLVVFRPSRLALHEVLVRVSSDLSVPDGRKVEDLGINFRDFTRRILAHLEPHAPEIDALYASNRQELAARVGKELGGLDADGAAAAASRWSALAEDAAAPPPSRAAWRALGRVVSAILVRHGRFWGPREVIAAIATGMACNELAADEIGRLVEPWFRVAALAEGIRQLPAQKEPVVMNTKGASASGKSTIRLLQRELARELGSDWGDFALVSPDIWRKQLLDYGSLGPAYKYAGSFTGEELRIVDQKLDRYMAAKAASGRMPHLLIDRFRFDSFARHSDEAGSNLLTRFGRVVYLFFMVTHPASLVERAWKRGLDVGRFKAVDDTLAHSVEAYSGMPEVFFTWVLRPDKRVHFEFLDNEVPAGARPLTAAYGWNEVLNVFDVKPLLGVERYRKIDIDARSPGELFRDPAQLAAGRNAGFLEACVKRFPTVRFAERGSGRIYLSVAWGRAQWADGPMLARALEEPDTRAALEATVPSAFVAGLPGAPDGEELATADRMHTIGQWGPAR